MIWGKLGRGRVILFEMRRRREKRIKRSDGSDGKVCSWRKKGLI